MSLALYWNNNLSTKIQMLSELLFYNFLLGNHMDSVDERTKRLIISVISAIIPQAKIILFGSRARKDFSPRSDIDVAIDAGKIIDIRLIGEARDMLKASNITLGIDIVDVHAISTSMAENIKKEGIIWKN